MTYKAALYAEGYNLYVIASGEGYNLIVIGRLPVRQV